MDAPHQYVSHSGAVVDEALFGDSVVRFLYSTARERAPWMMRAVGSAWLTELLANLQFDLPLAPHLLGNRGFLARSGVDLSEAVEPPSSFRTPRHIFERRIRWWECRPGPQRADVVVSPCDARVLVGSLRDGHPLQVKGALFDLEALLGRDKPRWRAALAEADWAVLRLTPDRYHWNHTPVAGLVRDIYTVEGQFHACNPSATVALVTPLSMNARVVTVIDTDVPGGTQVGLVAMIEVVALMIGEVVQRYSAHRYDDPQLVVPGLFVERGVPKSLYRPGSSTTVLLFQPGRVCFDERLVHNARRTDVRSRLSAGFHHPLVETDVRVRSPLAHRPLAHNTVEVHP